MSMFVDCHGICPACGESVAYTGILSWHMFFKPTQRSDRTVSGSPPAFAEKRTCSNCGLIHDSSVKEMPQLREFAKSEEYLTCRGHLHMLEQARDDDACVDYYRLGMVFEKNNQPCLAARSYLECANTAQNQAEEARQLCYHEVLRCYRGQKLSLEERMVQLDMLRRSEQWSAARLAALHPLVIDGKYKPMAVAQLRWITEKDSQLHNWVD